MGWISQHAQGLRDEGRLQQPVLLTPVETLRRWYTYWSQRVCISRLWLVSISWRRPESGPRWGLLLSTLGTRRYVSGFKPLLGKRGGRISDLTYINHEVFSPVWKEFLLSLLLKGDFFFLSSSSLNSSFAHSHPAFLLCYVSDTTLCLPQNWVMLLKSSTAAWYFFSTWVCSVELKAL